MATKLVKPLKREIRVYGVECPVILTITEFGVVMNVPGSRQKLTGSWERIAKALQTPANVKSYLAEKPLELLRSQAGQLKSKP